MLDHHILSRLRHVWHNLTTPRAADVDEARREYMTKAALLISSAMTLAVNVPLIIEWSIGTMPDLPLAGVVLNALFVGGWLLAHRGYWRLSSVGLTGLVFLAAVYDNYLEGVSSPAMLYYAVAILLAAMLQETGIQWPVAGLSVVAYVGLGLAHILGFLSPAPIMPETAFYSWAPGGFALVTIGLLQWLSGEQYRQTLAQSHAYAADLEHVNEQVRQRTRVLSQLNRLGQELAATLDLNQIATQLPRVAADVIGTESASVWLLDAERGELTCWAAHDYLQYQHEASPIDRRVSLGQGVAGWVAQTGKSANVPNVDSDPRFYPKIDDQTGFRTRSILAVPLRARNTIIGVLEMLNKPVGEFTAEDMNLVQTLAASLAVAIDNARLVEELRRYTADLEAQNAELDAFAHTVAHDLKSPLSVLMGFSNVLNERFGDMPEQNARLALQRIEQYSRKMINIIDELLLLASVRKKKDVEQKPLPMATIVAQACERLGGMIAESGAEIITPERWPSALGYAPWVEEVWVNYISNAIKYGGKPPRVELGFDKSAHADLRSGQIMFWVRDNGPGLGPEEQAQLFTPFTRLHQVRAEGHGLGLSIVRRIIEKLGGQVGVESQAEQGSLFYFILESDSSI
ncbi:MAG: GAF domain-containing protein [Thermoflexales bacterium]|nr:GAF domain-containing protein [Thermoflexales bacterium]